MGRMSNKEKLEWENLYEYVKTSILNYPKEKSLPKFLILRLKGLRGGKFIANKNTRNKGDYTFDKILLTFKINKFNIIRAINDKSKFKDEKHMINYIMTIVENNINDVFDLIESKEKAEKMVDKVVINDDNDKSVYIQKTKENKNKRLEDLW